jgi:hypothetical protein
MKKAMPPGKKAVRPGSVVVAGWCAILFVPLILVRITMVLTSGQLLTTMAETMVDPAAWLSTQGLDTLVLLLVGPIVVVSLVAGIAILSLKRWAWVVLMMFLVLALVLNLVRSYFTQPEYGLMLIYAVLAFILNQPEVRQAFRIGRPSNEPVE